MLRHVIDGTMKATEGDVSWAREALALVLANGTDFQRFQEALALVGLRVDGNGDLVREPARLRVEQTETVLTRASVLATQPIRSFRDRAIELFDDLDRGQALTPNDKLVLALLYESSGQWPRARAQLDSLVTQHPGVQQFLVEYVQLLLRHDEPDRAAAELTKLEELENKRAAGTNAYATEDLRMALLEKTGQKDAAVALMRRIVSPSRHPTGGNHRHDRRAHAGGPV